MSAKVFELDDHRRIWATSSARCGACGYRWLAIWPAGAKDARDYGWECPACHQAAGLEIVRHEP